MQKLECRMQKRLACCASRIRFCFLHSAFGLPPSPRSIIRSAPVSDTGGGRAQAPWSKARRGSRFPPFRALETQLFLSSGDVGKHLEADHETAIALVVGILVVRDHVQGEIS